MTIIEKARELGEMIQASEQMKKVKETEAIQAEDENAKTLMIEFNMQRMNLVRDMQSGKIKQEEAVQKNNEAFEKMVEKSQVIKDYIDAKKDLDALVNEVNNILTFYITGQDPNCTHNCSTCGGCH